MQISFGKKIPISTCNIYDKYSGNYTKSTLYEIDCKDRSDIKYIKDIKGVWNYKNEIVLNAEDKHRILSNNKNAACRKQPKDDFYLHGNQFFSLETPEKDVVCLCQTEQYGDDIDITFLESGGRNRFRYCAQTMLAFIAKHLLNTDKILTIRIPAYNATWFYSDVCKFERVCNHSGFELPEENMISFVQNVEERTNGEIIDIAKGSRK